MKLLVLLLAVTGFAQEPAPDVERIMSQVGINQAEAQDLRNLYVYTQKQLLRFVLERRDGSVVGVRHAWTFDDMFSAFAIQGIEAKKKGEAK